jgi:DNA segregation ATPase FtsK/SpoIIIE-like protein
MKNLKKIWVIALVAFLLIVSAPHKTMAQEGEYISDQEFYDELQPYGTWIYDPQYGNVWIPDVEEDFRPYATRGYWAMTTYGNTWVSDYPWGWATFHYGRWHFDNYYGWEWVPGNEWAPAWVSWRNGGGYYGWAPMEPGVSIDMAFEDNYSVPNDYWVFAPYAYINYTNVYNYYVPRTRVRNIIRNTTWIRNRYTYNNRSYITGPHRDEIQRYTKRPVRVYNINNVSRPSRITVNNNNINIYRPAVRQNTNARPARVVDGAAYKEQNPAQRIGSRDRQKGSGYNAANAAKLAAAARAAAPDTKVVRVNNNNNARPATSPANTSRPTRPVVTGDAQQQQHAIDRQQGAAQQQQVRQQQEQQRQQQQRQVRGQQQGVQQQTEQQKQQLEQQRQQQQQVRQQRANRPAVVDNTKQQDQQRQQQAEQQQQVRQQQQQAREQQQVRQQQEQQRQQQQQQAREQQRQQQDQQRQQQQQAREQQRQQQQPQPAAAPSRRPVRE